VQYFINTSIASAVTFALPPFLKQNEIYRRSEFEAGVFSLQ
jgi:hypothetical protein